MKIYGFYNSTDPYPGGLGAQAIAISETGDVVASHFCSNESFARGDLGMNGSDWSGKHERYNEYAPDGYELEFVLCKDLFSHEGLNIALNLNDEKEMSDEN